MWELLEFKHVWFLLVAALATEAATNLLTKSEFSIRTIKKFIFKWRHVWPCQFMHDLFDCGYCTSVWIAIPAAYWYLERINYVDLIVFTLIIHRLSNILHFFIDVLDEKRSREF
jgi:hypothetical protein